MIKDALKKILPQQILSPILTRLNFEKIQEIRLRAGGVVKLNYGGKVYPLSTNGLGTATDNPYICVNAQMVHELVVRASENSLYAVNDKLKTGFITIEGGIRVGIAGEVVFEGENIKTIKNFSSVNIRVPHEVKGCADKVVKELFASDIESTLVISPPGAGKTTLLRDIARQISSLATVLIVDERCEIASQHKGIMQLDVGTNTDVISSCSKEYAFTHGIRSLAPDVIITDELALEKDISSVEKALSSGVKVIASVHASSYSDIEKRTAFRRILQNKGFTNFIVLSKSPTVGSVKEIKCQ